MAEYRIEILFSGEAPGDEMERARILGAEDVAAAIRSLSDALETRGLAHQVRAQTVRRNVKKPLLSAQDVLSARDKIIANQLRGLPDQAAE